MAIKLHKSLLGRLMSRLHTKFKARLLAFATAVLICLFIISVPILKVEVNWFPSYIRFSGIYPRSEFIPKINVFEMENITMPLKIAIWISPKTDNPKYRTKLVKTMIVDPQNKNACFYQKYKCEMSMERNTTTLRTADAILFFMFNKNYQWETLPPSWQKWRRQDQIWVINADEAPVNHVTHVDDGPAVFNWSITYRRDSTVWLPYGRAVLLPSSLSTEGKHNKNTKAEIEINKFSLSEWIRRKTKLIVGIISHCTTASRREILIHQMITSGGNRSIDIYGHCGELKLQCNFYATNCTNFWGFVANTYKFYLAFENSLCVDYITEKFWRSLELGIVPVVYGGANYTQLAPRNSFIDVHDFESSKDLMEYLKRVGNNATEYAKYFEWRRDFKLVTTGNMYMSGNDQAWCELCEKLRIFKSKTDVGGGGISQLPGNWWNRMSNTAMVKPCKIYQADLNLNFKFKNLSTIKYLPSLRKVNVIDVNSRKE